MASGEVSIMSNSFGQRIIFVNILFFIFFPSLKADNNTLLVLAQLFDGEIETVEFSPLGAEYLHNDLPLRQLVATLVRPVRQTMDEPYLAESFAISVDSLRYNFKLREGVKCEDGEPITAENYYDVLHIVATFFKKKNKPLFFSNLEGWSAFQKGENSKITGISFSKNTLSFKLSHRDPDILTYLNMPVFGYFCKKNFDAKGRFINPKTIISSNLYKLIERTQDHIILAKRSDWLLSDSHHSPQKIKMSYPNYKYIQNILKANKGNIFAIVKNKNRLSIPSVYKIHSGPPNLLAVLNLSNRTANSPFQDIATRRHFSKYFYEQFQKNLAEKPGYFLTDSIFLFNNSKIKVDPPVTKKFLPNKNLRKKVKFLSSLPKPGKFQPINNAVNYAAQKMGFEIEYTDWKNKSLISVSVANHAHMFDIRYVSVATGASITNWVIDMMWCTNMGAGFIDTDGRICNMTKTFRQQGSKMNKAYIETFNQIVYEQKSVLPLYVRRDNIILGDQVKLKSKSMTFEFNYFDQLEIY